ncbi:MAG: precorrin-6y C5,15-methyltransferase (decarboxylating) subunit CbiE, partial [Candidatus Omnitrophica bacterium]|nr:precorrin-6y C5,15-methyltransferase (decarboxylating) subunit CbiE [Candidatus Omnitrophota bacterium]
MGKVYIIGTGPGSRDYILPLAEKAIHQADIVIGAERLLSFCPKGKKTIVLKGNYSRVLDYIKKNKEKKKIAVLVSGSPGVFSFSRKIISALKHFEYEVIPGVSPLQIACALAGETWDDLRIVSLHGKTLRGLARTVIANKKVMVFCDNRNT